MPVRMICICSVLKDLFAKHLMTGPEGNSEFCFPRGMSIEVDGNKIHCFGGTKCFVMYLPTQK